MEIKIEVDYKAITIAYEAIGYMGYSLIAQKEIKGCSCEVASCTMKEKDCVKRV